MVDFTKIRSHEGSQNNAFEELVCQLANLQKPENSEVFIRKEGAGGDAGVECYWRLKDSSEIGWQAKYFIGGMDSSKRRQLDESFNAALDKHPKLKKYIVSLPMDRTDSRKKGRGGKQVVSFQDEWDAIVKKWAELAKDKGRSIEFEYWGKHELTLFLTKDSPLYSGRALYWFNEPILGFDTLKSVAHRSRECLGERYTPEFHVDLPIAESFDALCSNPEWWERVKKEKAELIGQQDQLFRKFLNKDYPFINKNQIKKLEGICARLIRMIDQSINQKNLINNINDIRAECEKIQSYQNKLGEEVKEDDENSDEYAHYVTYSGEYSVIKSFFYQYQSFLSFLNSKSVKAAEIRAALLYGEAGIGKSHLLCDMSLHRLKANLPTVFLLGNRYEGGNPIQTLKGELDLLAFSNKQVLGALDALGEAYRTKATIIIDAINEGLHRDDWYNHLRAFLSELSDYQNISILISCRTTYLDYMLPDSINEECLARIFHTGFQGYEHRAAEKYMSKQGISKPSAPILAPEFSNPLFLKTCCQALKNNDMTSFPKGMQGITNIFEFYLASIEKIISKKKKYSPAEEIIKSSLIEFSSQLFPENLNGIPNAKARKIINGFDPNLNKGDSLFDELINEGILSEDISYDREGKGRPVIRFTYERFSDHFVAQQIIEKYDNKSIQSVFSENEPLGELILKNGFYRYEGIFEAISIVIAEKYHLELIELLPKGYERHIDSWVLSRIFTETVTWRSASSFTDRTLQILNNLTSYEYQSPAIETLLKLSTEPNHPWNANLLHKNLIDKDMPERDHFWSIIIALGDYTEEDGEAESIVRTLIEWSCFGDIEGIEEERARLCAVTLLWFLTTSNRKVRDQSTKSLVRLLSSYPHLLPELIKEFHNVNDLYLVERLYAVSYGVVCNISDKDLIAEISKIVFNLVFKEGRPIPHILLRDYARGILEFAFCNELLSKEIDPKLFRPPYKSKWPIENPTKKEMEKIEGDEFSSLIKSSLMGFPGDFGNYTMSCVHHWSPTPLLEPTPKTGGDYKREFAESFLNGDIKKQYLDRIKPTKKSSAPPVDLETLQEQIKIYEKRELIELIQQESEEGRKKEQSFREKIEESLNEEQKEYFRWLSGLGDDRPAAFSRKWAQRWVCKRAHELGWKKELFEGFEKRCSHGRGGGPGGGNLERIGKKYQWVALHELLARLSDNVHWIDRGYSDIEDVEYYGPWQMHKRNIDPTIWIRSNGEKNSFSKKKNTWWQSYRFPLEKFNSLKEQLDFMWSEKDVPNFSNILEVSDPKKSGDWLVLRGFWMQMQNEDMEDTVRLDAWFRVNSIVIQKDDFEKIKNSIGTKNLIDPHTVSIPSTQHQGYLGEYPWHLSCRFMTGWVDNSENPWPQDIAGKYFVPVSEYEWESGSVDHSLDSSLSFYLPAADIIRDLGLLRSKENFGAWRNEKNEVIFLDPSVSEEGPSFALIRKKEFQGWLDKNDLEIIWLIGGEKQLFKSHSTFYGRLVYNTLCRRTESGLMMNTWFEREEPRSK